METKTGIITAMGKMSPSGDIVFLLDNTQEKNITTEKIDTTGLLGKQVELQMIDKTHFQGWKIVELGETDPKEEMVMEETKVEEPKGEMKTEEEIRKEVEAEAGEMPIEEKQAEPPQEILKEDPEKEPEKPKEDKPQEEKVEKEKKEMEKKEKAEEQEKKESDNKEVTSGEIAPDKDNMMPTQLGGLLIKFEREKTPLLINRMENAGRILFVGSDYIEFEIIREEVKTKKKKNPETKKMEEYKETKIYKETTFISLNKIDIISRGELEVVKPEPVNDDLADI